MTQSLLSAGLREGGLQGADVQMLHESLLEAERRAAMLADVIAALSQSPDATILAQRAVELVGRAAHADGAFVYFWEADRDLLVLRAATEGRQQQFVDKLTLRLGEGLTGWSALMRRPAVVHDELLEDPRFLHVPSLNEGEFASALVAPILVPGGHPVGVFALYSREAHVFDDQTVETVAEVAQLLASGIDRAEQFEVRTRQSRALHELAGLADSPPRTTSAAAAAVAERCLAIIPGSLCVVELAESERHADETLVGLAVQRADGHRLPDRAAATGTTDRESVAKLLRNWEAHLESLTGAIRVGGRLIGTVTCYRPARFTGDDRLLLEAVCNYAALVLTATTAAAASPLDELMRSHDPSHAEQILVEVGWVPKSLVTPFVIHLDQHREVMRHQALESATRAVEGVINTRVRRLIPGATGHVGGLVMGAVTDEEVQATMGSEVAECLEANGQHVDFVVGWGGPSAASAGVVEGMRAAEEAATWSALMRGAHAVLSHRHIGLLRSIGAVVDDRRTELARTRAEIAGLALADAETGSALLETLRAHVECHGSAADAAKRLFIHRNTMRQRLDKLERELSTPLDSPEGWLVTRLALLMHDRDVDIPP